MNDFDVSLTDTAGDYHQWPRDQVKVEVEDDWADTVPCYRNTRMRISITSLPIW